MRAHLRAAARRRSSRRGAAFAVAMLVVALISIGGIVALNAAAYDVATTGAVRTATFAGSVAETGLAVSRCEMCDSIDGVTASMQRVRRDTGRSAEFVMRDEELLARLNPATSYFEQPTAGPARRGSFGFIGATPPTVDFQVRIDRPRESGGVTGYAMREGAGADSGTLCFRHFRVTSTGTLTPPNMPTDERAARGEHRSFVVVGPVECSQ